MSQVTTTPTPPARAAAALNAIGDCIRTARIRRRQSAKELAGRIGVSLPTLRKLERGDPTVSLGTFATALWVLDLLEPVREAVRPESDRLAASLEATRLPARVRRRGKEVDLDRL